MASVKGYSSLAPSVVSLPGVAAGALGVALDRVEARVVVELLGEEGISVEVSGASGVVARAAYLAASRLLEEMGEEARLRVRLWLASPSLSPVVSVVAGVTAALVGLLGIEPAPMDLARVLNRVVAEATGSPMAPLVAAALYGGVSAGSESPALYAGLLGRPSWSIYVVEAGAELPRGEEVMVTIDRVRQITTGLGVLVSYANASGWDERLQGFLSQPSPWDAVAAEAVDKARKAALEEGAIGAGVDPYLGHLVIVGGGPGAAERAARILAPVLGHKPFIVGTGISERGALGAEEELVAPS